jgi:hypothetical protein
VDCTLRKKARTIEVAAAEVKEAKTMEDLKEQGKDKDD